MLLSTGRLRLLTRPAAAACRPLARFSTLPPLPNEPTKTLGEKEYRSRRSAEVHEAIDAMLRVDHAGEFGAVRIYEGQMAVLQLLHPDDATTLNTLKEMRAHEQSHLDSLDGLIPMHRARPTALLPLWSLAGYALGAGTALLGKKAAMACTVAVEEAIIDHYNDQLRTLSEPRFVKHVESDKEVAAVKQMIKSNRDDEDLHRQIGLDNNALEAPFYSTISTVIKTGCKAAIWLSSRV